jgi:Protein of unknown function (DUF3592)
MSHRVRAAPRRDTYTKSKEKPMKKRQEIRQALREANTGCLLMLIGVPGSFFALLAAIFLFIGFNEIYKQQQLITNAIAVQATIESSHVETSISSSGSGNASRTEYIPIVQYTYTIDNTNHTTHSVWPAPRAFSTQSEAAAIASQFKPSQIVTAHVDPANPASAYLLLRWSAAPYLAVAIAPPVVAFVIALGVLLAGYRNLLRAAIAAAASLTFTAATAAIAIPHFFQHVEPIAMTPALATISLAAIASLTPLAALAKARSLQRVLVSDA